MTPTLRALPVLAALALAACEPVPVATPTPDPDAGACGAEGLQDFVGQDASVIAATLFTNPIRVIRPGDVVTLEFNPERINFEVGPDERIARVYCG